jgi:hypothetical protein
LLAYLLRKSEDSQSSLQLAAKTWDLADAYKQIPLSDQAFEQDAYLAVFCPSTGRAEVFQQKVLPFGSVASVTAFLRVAHGIWKVGTKLLRLMWGFYFDVASAKHTDLVISSMFCLLGWKLSEDKLIDYHTVCKVRGVEFDLKMAGAGLATVSNTEERVRELCDQLENTIQAKNLKRVDGEKLRGRLQFANGQLFGRSSRNRLRILSKHISSGRQTLCEETVSALSGLREQLLQNSPRRILGPMSDYMHVSVDASFDLDGYSGCSIFQ